MSDPGLEEIVLRVYSNFNIADINERYENVVKRIIKAIKKANLVYESYWIRC